MRKMPASGPVPDIIPITGLGVGLGFRESGGGIGDDAETAAEGWA